MHTIAQRHNERVWFLDNIRYLMVLLVVVGHSANSYSAVASWWAIQDAGSMAIDILLAILESFLMPALFFISGYFALPSLQKRNHWIFIKGKLKRLGIPIIVGAVMFPPIRVFLYWRSRGISTETDLWGGFIENLKFMVSFKTGIIMSPSAYHISYFWFISLLLLFFILFALIHRSAEVVLSNTMSFKTVKAGSNRSILTTLIAMGVISALAGIYLTLVVYTPENPDPWITICSFIQFQASRIVLYSLCFATGMYAYKARWFVQGRVPGPFMLWCIISLILAIFYLWVLILIVKTVTMPLFVAMTFLRIFLFLSLLLAFISFGSNYWNHSSKTDQLLAANSYTVYLIHLVFVMLMQFYLLGMNIPTLMKFMIVILSAATISITLSHYVIRRFPAWSILGMATGFVLTAYLIPLG